MEAPAAGLVTFATTTRNYARDFVAAAEKYILPNVLMCLSSGLKAYDEFFIAPVRRLS